jgi:rRNA maturation RNase YbeY
MKQIHFYTQDSSFILKKKNALRKWIQTAVEDHQKQILLINYIFTNDNVLLDINKQYLDHDSYTDIITFDQSSQKNQIEADIYISVERVKENARDLKLPFLEELHRVMIHGILHLLGFKDKSAIEKSEMRKLENHFLALRF